MQTNAVSRFCVLACFRILEPRRSPLRS
jgi:hypothetical protein